MDLGRRSEGFGTVLKGFLIMLGKFWEGWGRDLVEFERIGGGLRQSLYLDAPLVHEASQ